MPAILTPALALRHLRELSTDLRAAVAFDGDGALAAGDEAIEAPARALLDALGDRAAATVATPRGSVLAARRPSGALVVVAGPHALLALLRHDLDTLLGDTAPAADATTAAGRDAAPVPPASPLPAGAEAAADALLRAAAGDLAR